MADRKTPNRGMRDEAGVGPNPRDARRLIPLRDLDDYKVAEGEPDIRGWNVYTATGREIGEIEDLLVDTDIGEVVMVDIDLKRDDRHTLAPIKAAWIDRATRRIVLNTTMFDVDDAIPALRRPNEPVESESVRHFNERYEQAYGADGWDRDRDITIRRANEDFHISRSVPPAPAGASHRVVDDRPADRLDPRLADDRIPDRTTDRPVERAADAVRRDVARDAARDDALQPERRRFVRYGQSRTDAAPSALSRADLSPAETERLRQQSGDLTTDARDTLVSRPPTEERR